MLQGLLLGNRAAQMTICPIITGHKALCTDTDHCAHQCLKRESGSLNVSRPNVGSIQPFHSCNRALNKCPLARWIAEEL